MQYYLAIMPNKRKNVFFGFDLPSM